MRQSSSPSRHHVLALAACLAAWTTGCATDETIAAAGVDVSLVDAAPDAGTAVASPSSVPRRPLARPQARQKAANPGPIDISHRWPGAVVQPRRVDDHGHIAGPAFMRPNPADPVADQRQFFVAWLRVSMPTAGPGQPGRVTAVFTPQAGEAGDYWKIHDASVLCKQGAARVKGTNLRHIDCGDEELPVRP